ncbi:uncharacterized protein LOC113780749 [Coffea eugenioides]|uniref:uncharacterized protein LOC113780749 n=1 Tax=Coffea eugenioides TaxID=49369 RepID=UPI000F6111F6|nr:uncharacterized protein LOC113780749 [Coffea eugenioides]
MGQKDIKEKIEGEGKRDGGEKEGKIGQERDKWEEILKSNVRGEREERKRLEVQQENQQQEGTQELQNKKMEEESQANLKVSNMDKDEQAICLHQENEASDHSILILDTNPNQRKSKRRFYFDQRWARNEDSKGIIKTAWGIEQKGSRMFKVMRKIRECRMVLLVWNKKLKMNSGKKITQIKKKLQEIKESNGEGKRGQLADLKLQLSKAYKEEELFWSQKARCRWLQEGDKNTAYFHASVMATRRRNKITVLQRNNGDWCNTDQELGGNMQLLPTVVPNAISRQMNERLIQLVNEAEIKKALFSMHPNKSPGTDGNMLRAVNEILITLIPKIDNPLNLTQYRPISLCNTMYKIISKVLANMLKMVLKKCINDSLICCKATVQEAKQVKDILLKYTKISGQLVNFEKSAVYFSRNTPTHVKEKVCHELGNMREAGSGRYLGLPMAIGRSKNQVFGYIMSSVMNKMKGWKNKMLSSAGKEVLIKSVIQAMPNYAMASFKLPKGLCKDICKGIANFWWESTQQDRKMHTISWKNLSKVKGKGGLGFRDLEAFNEALLAKQLWRIITSPNLLMSKVIRAKYLQVPDALDSNPLQSAS